MKDSMKYRSKYTTCYCRKMGCNFHQEKHRSSTLQEDFTTKTPSLILPPNKTIIEIMSAGNDLTFTPIISALLSKLPVGG